MNRFFFIFMAMLYLVMSTGIASYKYICKENYSNISSAISNASNENPDFPCHTCEKRVDGNKESCPNKKCCNKEVKLIKVDDFTNYQPQPDLSLRALFSVLPDLIFDDLFDISSLSKNTDNSPPPYFSRLLTLGNPYFIFYCVYRI